MKASTSKPRLALGLLIHPTGNHVASWLHPSAQVDAGSNFAHYAQLAKTAEAGCFDFMFLADALAVRGGHMEALSRWPQYMAYFEPTTLLSALAALTRNLGLVATATTSYNEPFNIARRFASLDHISHGRAGWNVVTSSNPDEALNFGRPEHFKHGDRYARAREFVEVVKKLWDSWEDDAFIRDRASGRYFEPSKLHVAHHAQEHFNVRGPLNISRAPQGYPVIAQAGASEDGRELAAHSAEIVFTPLHSLDKAKAFYQDVKRRMDKYRRAEDQMKITPGLNVIVGATRDEAVRKQKHLESLVHPAVGLELLSNALGGIDLAGCDIDRPLPLSLIPEDTNTSKGTLAHTIEMSQKEGTTVRQLYLEYAGARGQRTLLGTPQSIVDDMEEWFHSKGVDGFLIQPSVAPADLVDFVDLVVPELQRRDLLRTFYEGGTLRDNLQLARPDNRHAASTTGERS
ncbi:Nitrilotriacetate monooxygenase component A [Variovorax sp. SRS16]|uniref:LLM class flavin-dependent oxidoreductase n=1 Tax=Variovorax sp. SRS16 TaxID=282217 RepID=UPI0013184915|nr:LLM class flavin-dependent oxidoreductase [Variovorax sp. SRS16]VTU12831.1 Nitrilotriacetate monooxygenase component A [Variovorax sp. SRS16]